jgi:UPF0755 protein
VVEQARWAVSRALGIGALLAMLALSGAAAWTWRDLTSPATPGGGMALISIAPGEPLGAVAARLVEARVIRHAWTLRLWARWNRLDRQMQPGEYRFDRPRSPIEVAGVLCSPVAALHRVIIPEGATVARTAELLAAAGFGGADVFRCVTRDPNLLLDLNLPATGIEGYLFPDTYAFAWGTAPQDIVRTMVSRFRDEAAALDARRRAAGLSEHAMVTLASLIEAETGAARERPLIAAVFHNRLRIGMPLQSDPTAVYGRPGHVIPTAADLSADSPYNTYLHRGVPPGPICNPGRAALEAALAPAPTQYLYFVSRKDGTHEFSTSLDEHNRAVARFQRDGRLRP